MSGLKSRASFPLNGAFCVEVLLGRVVSDVRFDSHDFARDEREHGAEDAPPAGQYNRLWVAWA